MIVDDDDKGTIEIPPPDGYSDQGRSRHPITVLVGRVKLLKWELTVMEKKIGEYNGWLHGNFFVDVKFAWK